MRRLLRHPQGKIGAGVLAVALVLAVFGVALAPASPFAEDLGQRLRPPMVRLPGGRIAYFGTDQLGRDLLARVIAGAHVSVEVGLSAVALAGVVGGAAGLVAGYHGGATDAVVMRIADFQLALPLILLGIAWAAFIGTGVASVIAVVMLSGWVQYARVVRSMALALRSSGFVEACTALGGTGTRVIVRHLVPMVLPTVAVLATLQLGRAVLLEATLSFLGLGLQPPTPAWGLMLSDGRSYIDSAWWVTLFPGAAISAFVLGANLFGDAIRDVFDPRLASRSAVFYKGV